MSVRQDRHAVAVTRRPLALVTEPEVIVLDPGGDLAWRDQALCAQSDPDAWFPEKGGSTRVPKMICRGCPVKAECLEFALETDQRWGVWGGLSEHERRRLKRVAA
jgi:WhiB family transcriptional regulator, redox-sensing transcriptional regulator